MDKNREILIFNNIEMLKEKKNIWNIFTWNIFVYVNKSFNVIFCCWHLDGQFVYVVCIYFSFFFVFLEEHIEGKVLWQKLRLFTYL